MATAAKAGGRESRHLDLAVEGSVLSDAGLWQRGDPLHFWKLLKNLPHGGEGPWKIEVGGIEPSHDFARGFGEAFVDGSVLAAIGFAAPKGQAVGMAADDFATAVGGSAIDHDILQVGSTTIRREKDALNRLLQMRRLVVGRRNDGNFHEELNKINRI